MRRSYEDYHVLEEVGIVEILENIGIALERACDVLEKLLVLEVKATEAAEVAADLPQNDCRCAQVEQAAEKMPAFKIGADLGSTIDEDVIGRIFGVV